MNVVRGGQSMFAKKDLKKPTEQVSWGTWVWNNIVGEPTKENNSNNSSNSATGSNAGGIIVGGGQSNVVVRALKGVSETIFGF